MANALDRLRQLANETATNQRAEQAINASYDFDSWRQAEADARTPAQRAQIEANRAQYLQAVAPALEQNRIREQALAVAAEQAAAAQETAAGAAGAGKIGVAEAIGGGIVNGLWNSGKGVYDLGASKVAEGISSMDSTRLLGIDASTKSQLYDYELKNRLGDIWSGYKPGDGTLRQNLKDTVFTAYHSGLQQLLEGRGRLKSPALDAIYKGSNAMFHLLRQYALPSITGSDDANENAKWLTEKAYGAAEKAEDLVSSWKPTQYADSEKFQTALGKSSKAAKVAGNVSSVVANMLPSITASVATGSPDIGLTMMAASAAGNAASEAMKNGATPEQAYYIGLEKGLVEYGSERMFDAVGVFGGGAISPGLKNLLGDVALTKFGRAMVKLANVGGENVEEAIADWAAPGIEKAAMGQTFNNRARQEAGLPEEDDDASFAQALLGQAPWTEEGLVTLLSTLVLGGIGSVVRNNIVTVPKEQAQEILDIARNSGNRRLEALAEEYSRILESRGRIGQDRIQTVYNAANRVVGEEQVRRTLDKGGLARAFTGMEVSSDGARLSESEAGALADYYRPEESSTEEYYHAAREAYRYGRNGYSLEEYRQQGQFADKLTENQSESAWKLGALAQRDGKGGTVTLDTSTEEGRETLLSGLSRFGEHAEEIAKVYEPTQSVERFRTAMDRAVNVYAAHGADVQEIVQSARDGSRRSVLGYLTDAQAAVAQQIGDQIRQERILQAAEGSEKYTGLKTRVRAMLEAGQNLRELRSGLSEARAYLKTAQADFDAAVQEMTAMQDSGEWDTRAEAYQEVVDRVNQLNDQIEGTKTVIGDLEKAVAAEEKKHGSRTEKVRKAAAGKVTVETEGGEIGGLTYKPADPSSFSDTQKAVVRIAETIAKVTGLNIHIVDLGSGFGGEYLPGTGGEVWLNINASLDGKNIAVGSIFHELTHWLQEYSPAEYEVLRDLVISEMMKNPERFEDILGERTNDYASVKKGIRQEEITNEMVANACQKVLADPEVVQRIVNEHRSLAERIRDFLLKIIDDIKAAFAELEQVGNRSVMREVHAAEGAIEGIREAWFEAFAVSSENLQAERAEKAARGENKNTATEGGEQMMLFDYDALIAKPDMHITQITTAENPTFSRKDVVAAGLRNAEQYGGRRGNGSRYVYVKDTGTNVGVSRGSLEHGLDRRIKLNGPVTEKIGEILSNAIRINESNPEDLLRTESSYILIGMAKNQNNEPTVVVFTVNRQTNDVESFETLHSANAKSDIGNKKIAAGSQSPGGGHNVPANPTASVISIEDLLKFVNRFQPDILPESVLRRFGYDRRPDGKLGERVLYQLVDVDPVQPKNAGIVVTKKGGAQFQMLDEVEETDRLIAVHNKSMSGLRRMISRGGVPFPSIAIKKAGTSHEGFGDVSIVFPRSSIDPEVNRQNRLYSNDAWTPTEPRTEYEVDIPYKIKERIRGAVGDDVFTALNGYSYLDDGEVARKLMNSTGNLFEAMKQTDVLKYAYLKSIGQAPEIPTKERELDGFYKYKNEELLAVFDAIGEDRIENGEWNDQALREEIADVLNRRHIKQLQDSLARKKKNGENTRAAELLLKKYAERPLYSPGMINLNSFQDALRKWQADGRKPVMIPDASLLKGALRDNTAVEKDPGFKDWIEKTFSKVVKNSGIPNGKDPYTDSGNRRSFRQTHVPATLENIVAQMQKEQERGIGIFGVNLRGAATKAYRTVEEMRADRGKLLGERISDDVYDSYMKEFFSRLSQIVGQAAKSERLKTLDSTQEILLEALRDANSKAQMGRLLSKEARWINLYPELTDELWQLKQDVQNMPAPYFEAKPRRIVYPQEALAYIVPESAEQTDAGLLEKMRDMGMNVVTYKDGDTQDRLEKLNAVPNSQFQVLRDPAQTSLFDIDDERMAQWSSGELEDEGPVAVVRSDDGTGFRSYSRRTVHPDILRRIEETERVQKSVFDYFRTLSEEERGYLSDEEVLDYLGMDDYYYAPVDSDYLYTLLYDAAMNRSGEERIEAFRHMKELVDTGSISYIWTLEDGPFPEFGKWYQAKRASLYYPGYQPGELFTPAGVYDRLAELNVKWEIEHLQGLLARDDLLEEDRREAQEFLDRLQNPQIQENHGNRPEIFYMILGEPLNDTRSESEDRADAYSRLQAENATLKETVKSLKDTVKTQDGTIGGLLKKFVRAKPADAEKLTKQLLRKYGSTADVAEVTEAVKAVGDYFLQTKARDLSEEKLKALARDAAELIARNAEAIEENPEDDILQEIRNRIRSAKITVSPEHVGDIAGYESLAEFRRKNFGPAVSVVTTDSKAVTPEHVSVERFYDELHSSYGDAYFPEIASENGPNNGGEMLSIIAQNYQAGDPMKVNPFRYHMGEAIEDIANTIAFRVMEENALRPFLPADAVKIMDEMQNAQGENKELRAKLEKALSRGEILKDELDRMQKSGQTSKKELLELRDSVYDLTQKLRKAENRYDRLKRESEDRLAQVKQEGKARALEVQAKERERAAEKIQGLKDHFREIQSNARKRREESAKVTKYRARVFERVDELYEMLERNDNKVHVPKILKQPLLEFLESIDLSSQRKLRGGRETRADKEFGARLRELERLLRNQQSYIDGGTDEAPNLGGYVDVNKDSMQFLEDTATLIDRAMKENRDYTVNDMSGEQLRDLANFLTNLKTAIRNMNDFMANARYQSVREAAAEDMRYMDTLGTAGNLTLSKAAGFLAWQNGVPYYVLKRFGKGGASIFDALARGWEIMAFDAQEIIDFAEKTYTTEEVRDWEHQVHTIRLRDGTELKMTTAQIMCLTMLYRREQAKMHIDRGGIQRRNIDVKGEPKQDMRKHHLTPGDIRDISALLTERQLAVAEALQHYMAVRGAEWGNEVSMRRFGYDFYTEGENYFPIKTVSEDRPMSDADLPQNASMFRLLNLSSSKSLNPHASNAVLVESIFDVFADHMSDMAKLHGMGLPVLDAIKWFNYKERTDLGNGQHNVKSLQGTIKQAYGDEALNYFRKLVKDINGTTESGDRGDPGFGKWMSNYKIAAVGANLRVAMLQMTSYLRASTVLQPRYLIGNAPSRKAYLEALKYSGTAVWKALGYYDTDIQKSMRGQIKHDDTLKDRIAEASMKGPELGDQATWSMLWSACKRQAAAQTGLSGEELCRAAADLFREVIYSSQVMDSTLTRSEIMRGKTRATKAASAFMAEPTLSYNLLLDAYSRLRQDARALGRGESWRRNGGALGKAFAIYAASAVFSAIVESIADAARDDDDEKYLDKWLEAFVGKDGKFWTGNLGQDLTILGKLPYIKDIVSRIQGYSSGDMALTGINNILNVIAIWWETYRLATGKQEKATKVTSYGRMTPWGKIYKSLQAVSQLTGVAVSNLTRDVTAIWNTVMNGRKDEWKIRTYDGNQLKAEQEESYGEYVQASGITKAQYKKILDTADVNGSMSPTQDELGTWLTEALRNGELTEEQAQALWKSQWHKGGSKTLDQWRGAAGGKPEESGAKTGDGGKTPSTATTTATTTTAARGGKDAYDLAVEKAAQTVTGYDDFRKAVPIYSNKKEAAYNAKPAGMSLDRYTELLQAADTSGNSSITQDEMGYALRDAVKSGEMTFAEAEKIWRSQWNSGGSRTLQSWAAKHP